jgi:mannan endo-1,4-beta-mannosidase
MSFLSLFREKLQKAVLAIEYLLLEHVSGACICSQICLNEAITDFPLLQWDGFYTYGTTFNLTAALANTSSVDYSLLIYDMDAIAKELQILQAANIPVLWRPLHEADGEWFWWGAYGPESCITLYRLMFDRYTRVHKLRNLIWLWNSVTPSWYPGADVVDILGYDSYLAIGDHGPVDTQYQELIELGNNTKMVTLPEVGNIPDPTVLKLYHADWSYFVTWDGVYIENDTYNSLAFKEQVYDDPTVLKLTDLGNWKGTPAVTASKTSSTIPTLQSSPTSKASTTTSTNSSSSKKSTTTSAALAATQSQYGQCGGTGWDGPTVCVSGATCISVSPPWYSQCL